ncbi:MAG: hypothetical protein AAF289_00945 [Cyanobacteria bacterium P01_A01_bin.135]
MHDCTQPPLNSSSSEKSQPERVELEFVQHLLAADEGYCWEPSAPGSEAYLDWLERRWLAEVDGKADSSEDLRETEFFTLLDQAWNEIDAPASSLMKEIAQGLGDRLPQELLNRLLTSAKQVLATGQPLGEQLVQCVQSLVPQLERDDLLIMARPYATAMRDRQDPISLNGIRSSVRAAQWSDLVPVERARLGLELSHYILTRLPHHGTPRETR